MLNIVKTTALSLMLAMGAAAALPAGASAEGLYLGLPHGGAQFGVDAGHHDGWRQRDRWDDRRGQGWRRDRWERDRRDRGGPRCTAGRALFKAQQLGLHRVVVRDIDRDTIRVSGRRFGERFTITFARAPSCPVIRW